MKPKNFPGRKMARRVRAGVQAPPPNFSSYQKDIRFRVGRAMRDVNGIPK